jgi:hypothetical protein
MVLCAEEGSVLGAAERVKMRLESMLKAGIDLENPWPGFMNAGDALQGLKDMREDMLPDGEVGEGGLRLNPISGAYTMFLLVFYRHKSRHRVLCGLYASCVVL